MTTNSEILTTDAVKTEAITTNTPETVGMPIIVLPSFLQNTSTKKTPTAPKSPRPNKNIKLDTAEEIDSLMLYVS